MNNEHIEPLENFRKDYCSATDITEKDFTDATMIDLMAKISACEETGQTIFHVTRHLIKYDNEILKGRELFDKMRAFYLDDYTQQANDGWEQWTETLHAQGLPLDDKQQAYINSLEERQEERQDEAQSFKIMQAQMKQGNIPEDYSGSPDMALNWLESFNKGKITEDQYNSYFSEHAKYNGGNE